MIQVIKGIQALIVALGLSESITPYTPHLTPAGRLKYSMYIVAAADENHLDPYLVAAVMWHESDFRNVPRNETNDYGLMQVHWQPGEKWLAGLTPADLMDPRTNILAGARELAALRRFCRLRDRAPRPPLDEPLQIRGCGTFRSVREDGAVASR